MPEEPMMGIVIHRSVQDVFDYVMDIEKTPLWRPRVSEVHWTTSDQPASAAGSRWVVRTLGLTVRFEPEIVEWDPRRRSPEELCVQRFPAVDVGFPREVLEGPGMAGSAHLAPAFGL